MIPHIKKCKYISEDDRTVILLNCRKTVPQPAKRPCPPLSPATLPSPSHHTAVVLSRSPIHPRPLKRAKSLHSNTSSGGIQTLLPLFPPSALQDEFSADLCKLIVASNASWRIADVPTLHRFIHKWVGPEVLVQNRRVLSGRVLVKEVAKVKGDIVAKVKGKMATGQCDGWKNVAKSSVVSTLMTVENEVSKAGF